jgi:PAP2 superfamily
VWQVTLALALVFVALFICASRYADSYHAGFDVVAGAANGAVFRWASFPLHYLPIRRAKGLLAWGPRFEHHAFLTRTENNGAMFDQELGRQSMGTELNHIGANPPARIHTGGSNQPILGHPGDEMQYGNPPYHGRGI